MSGRIVLLRFQSLAKLRRAAWALFALLLLFAPSLAFAHTSAAAVGRFLSPDPARFFDSRNLYAFCANDPVNGCDPDGMLEAQCRAAQSPGAFSVGVPPPRHNYMADGTIDDVVYRPEGRSYSAFWQASTAWYQGNYGQALGSFVHELFGRATGMDSLNAAGSGYDTYTQDKLTGSQRFGQGLAGAMTLATAALPMVGLEARAGTGVVGLDARLAGGALSSVSTEARLASSLAAETSFYVTADGVAIPANGYRAIGGTAVERAMAGDLMSHSGPTYITFTNLRGLSGADAKSILQLNYEPSHFATFNTLQLVNDLKTPRGRWNTLSAPEPIISTFPLRGRGGATQAITTTPIKNYTLKAF